MGVKYYYSCTACSYAWRGNEINSQCPSCGGRSPLRIHYSGMGGDLNRIAQQIETAREHLKCLETMFFQSIADEFSLGEIVQGGHDVGALHAVSRDGIILQDGTGEIDVCMDAVISCGIERPPVDSQEKTD